MALLEGLNSEQKSAVLAAAGPVVIVAGPGCGKTRTIICKIAYKIQNELREPNSILVLTFAQKAARGIEHELIQLGISGVEVHTFHAFALQMLRLFWPKKMSSKFPYIEENKEKIIFHILQNEQTIQADRAFIKNLSRHIERRKALNLSPWDYIKLEEDKLSLDPYFAIPSTDPGRDKQSAWTHEKGIHTRDLMLELMLEYEHFKLKENIFDFEDVLLAFAGMLETEVDVAHFMKERYVDFFVDEYQDISKIQHTLLHLFLQKRNNLCVVGDPSQCIYSFAGSDADFLLNFKTEFSDAQLIKLNKNYRSSKNIVSFANSVARNIRGSVQINSLGSLGSMVQVVQFASSQKEASGIVNWLNSLAQEGIPPGKIAVLVRTIKQQEFLISYFLKKGIPTSKSIDTVSTHSSSLVTIATIHSSKGLEWDAVWLAGLNEGILPYGQSRAVEPTQPNAGYSHKGSVIADTQIQETQESAVIDEERRLFYVAITRAKSRLMLSFSHNMGAPSRFIQESGMSIVNENQH